MPKLPHLTTAQARINLEKYGPNTLKEIPPISPLIILLNQVKNPLMYILIIAAFITLFLGDYIDALVISLASFANISLGFFQEYKAERALFALTKILTPTAKVIRDGQISTIDAKELVPSDVIYLSHGDRIPADGIVIESVGLSVNEAVLTGESLPVLKSVSSQNDPNIFMGTTVAAGRGIMRITQTGERTKFGQIAKTLETTPEESTPLQKRVRILAGFLAKLVIILTATIFALGLIYGETPIEIFTTAVAIAVSAIPEALIVSITVVLTIGMQKTLRRQGLVRRLASAETLGAVTTICIDKTGTITLGQMGIVKNDLIDRHLAVKCLVLANNLSDPLELAIWDWARSQNTIDPEKLTDETNRIKEIPFDESKKYMAVETREGLFIKGAPEILLEKSTLNKSEKKKWYTTLENYGKEGLRVLAIAFTSNPAPDWDKTLPPLEFLGIIGASDPIRSGVKEAIDIAQKAGVKVKIVTGDYELTARTVMKQLGIGIKDPDKEIIDGKELAVISEEELSNRVANLRLFARISPEQKLKIVLALQKNGEVVAMTGDGVNDALALKTADIGIAVAQATDVAKETADLVLLDSNFRTIVSAIEEGRVMFKNIKKIVLYLLSDAFHEMFLITASLFLRLPLPLSASQILWINIIADGAPDLALTFDPKDGNEMNKPPYNPRGALIDLQAKILIFAVTVSAGLLTLIVFIITLRFHSIEFARTLAFTLMATNSLVYVFSIRNLGKSVFLVNPFKNRILIISVVIGLILQIIAVYHPFFQTLFRTVPLPLPYWILIFSINGSVLVLVEIIKVFFLSRTKK
jgi:Ca2+-transporting ATPase